MAIGGPIARRRQTGGDRGASHIQLGFSDIGESGLWIKSQSQLAGKTYAVPMAVRLFVQVDGRHSRVSLGVSKSGGAVGGDVPQQRKAYSGYSAGRHSWQSQSLEDGLLLHRAGRGDSDSDGVH